MISDLIDSGMNLFFGLFFVHHSDNLRIIDFKFYNYIITKIHKCQVFLESVCYSATALV